VALKVAIPWLTEDATRERSNEPLGGNRLLPEKNRKIRGWRKNVEVIQNVRGMATVICGVVDDMKQNISARHGSATAANELKLK